MPIHQKPTRTAPRPTATGELTAQDFRAAALWPTVSEIADSYGVPTRWVFDQIAARKFRAVRVNVLRVDPEDFHRFLNERNTF